MMIRRPPKASGLRPGVVTAPWNKLRCGSDSKQILKPAAHFRLLTCLVIGLGLGWQQTDAAEPSSAPPAARRGNYHFDRTISREVLENFLSRSITMEGMFNGKGDLDDNIRMLTNIGAKYIGRSLCLWGAEANFLPNVQRARDEVPKMLAADPEMILE